MSEIFTTNDALSPLDIEDNDTSINEKKVKKYLSMLEQLFIDDKKHVDIARFHRLNKTLNAIKKTFKRISKCPMEGEASDLIRKLKQKNNETTTNDDPSTENTEPNDEEENQEPNEKNIDEVEQILNLLEKELDITYDKASNFNPDNYNEEHRRKLSKIYLDVELKLKAFLEEKRMEKLNLIRSESIETQDRPNKILPKIVSKFFEDTKSVEKVLKKLHRKKSAMEFYQQNFLRFSRAKISHCHTLAPIKEENYMKASNDVSDFDDTQNNVPNNVDLNSCIKSPQKEEEIQVINSELMSEFTSNIKDNNDCFNSISKVSNFSDDEDDLDEATMTKREKDMLNNINDFRKSKIFHDNPLTNLYGQDLYVDSSNDGSSSYGKFSSGFDLDPKGDFVKQFNDMKEH